MGQEQGCTMKTQRVHLLFQEVLLGPNDGAWPANSYPSNYFGVCKPVVLHYITGYQCPCPSKASCKRGAQMKYTVWQMHPHKHWNQTLPETTLAPSVIIILAANIHANLLSCRNLYFSLSSGKGKVKMSYGGGGESDVMKANGSGSHRPAGTRRDRDRGQRHKMEGWAEKKRAWEGLGCGNKEEQLNENCDWVPRKVKNDWCFWPRKLVQCWFHPWKPLVRKRKQGKS